MSVYKKLQEARIRLLHAELKKSGNNKFAGYQYFELPDFLPKTIEIFHELGLCDIPSFTADLAYLRIVDIETEKEIVITSPMGSAALKGCHEVQNIGAVQTYQRRYLLQAAMNISEHDALDATTGSEKPETTAKPRAVAKQETGPEPDAMIIAQFNAAKDVPALTKVFNGIPTGDRKLYNSIFQARMGELKKAA